MGTRTVLGRRTIAGLLALAAVLVGLATAGAGTAAAADPATAGGERGWPAWIEGRPDELERGGTNGWYFWHDAAGMHVRTTTPSDRNHPFTAVFSTNGRFFDIEKVRLEGRDDIRLLDNGRKLVVKFHTYSGIDGVDFKVAGTTLRLELREFGRLVPPSHIFAGQHSVHPPSNPFRVVRAIGL
jgi:hypothetical protein